MKIKNKLNAFLILVLGLSASQFVEAADGPKDCIPSYVKSLKEDYDFTDKLALASLCPLTWPVTLPAIGMTIYENCAHRKAAYLIKESKAGWGPTLDKMMIHLMELKVDLTMPELSYYIKTANQMGLFCAGKLSTYRDIFLGILDGSIEEAVDAADPNGRANIEAMTP